MKNRKKIIIITCVIIIAILVINPIIYTISKEREKRDIMFNTACTLVDEQGDYKTENPDKYGYIECKNFTCTIVYNNKKYEKACRH